MQSALLAFADSKKVDHFFATSYGVVIFPTVGKGGLGVGGAHGSGWGFRQGVFDGTSKMTQVTIGFQAGGQAFSQIIFFETEADFNRFASGNFELGAQASAVAITVGANAQASTWWRPRRRERGRQQCAHRPRRTVFRWHGYLHHGQGWPDVRSLRRRPEVQLPRPARVNFAGRTVCGSRGARAPDSACFEGEANRRRLRSRRAPMAPGTRKPQGSPPGVFPRRKLGCHQGTRSSGGGLE